MLRAIDYPEHDREGCSDIYAINVTADGTGCHRCTALALDTIESQARALTALRERVDKYRARLEVDHHFEGGSEETLTRVDLPFDEDEDYDGIECRDETVRLLDGALSEARDELAAKEARILTMRDALNLAKGAIVQCSPCMEPECLQTQQEWLDVAEKKIDAAIQEGGKS